MHLKQMKPKHFWLDQINFNWTKLKYIKKNKNRPKTKKKFETKCENRNFKKIFKF